MSERTYFLSPIKPKQVSYCGHKIDMDRPPRTNCQHCWDFFFLKNEEFTRSLAPHLLPDADDTVIVKKHGSKFLKRLQQFMIKIAKANEVVKELQKREAEEALQNVEYDIIVPSDGSGIQRIEKPAVTEQESIA